MAEKNNSNKILTILLAIVVCAAAVTILYVSLPQEGTEDNEIDEQDTDDQVDDDIVGSEAILNVTYNGDQTNYTLEELESMVAITGYGGYRTSYPAIKGQGTYTGFAVTTLVHEIAGGIENYSITVYSSDDENMTFNYTTIQGNVDIYNASNTSDSTPIGFGDVIMVVYYQKDGEYLDEESDGNLRLGFINQDEEKITNSSFWRKYVVSIEITQE